MMLKWIGAVLIIFGCGGFGFSLAAAHRREEKSLQQMISGLDFMQCRQTARQLSGSVQALFLNLAKELDNQICPDAAHCMAAALYQTENLSAHCREAARNLGKTMGQFDLEGQLTGLEAVRSQCRVRLAELTNGREVRLRNYQTLGLCAGAALVILFI